MPNAHSRRAGHVKMVLKMSIKGRRQASPAAMQHGQIEDIHIIPLTLITFYDPSLMACCECEWKQYAFSQQVAA